MKEFLNKSILFSVFTLLFLFIFTSSHALAKENTRTLRVAFFPLDCFFEYDENQEITGYGAEYLDKISEYTGYQFEYVPIDSWLTANEMVTTGELDILMPATKSMVGASSFAFSDYSILDAYLSILTLESRDDLFFSDNETIPHLKIGISLPVYEKTNISPYFEQLGIPYENLVFYDNFGACKKALYEGEIDAVVANIIDMSDDMKLLARLNYIPTYIATSPNSPFLNDINSALYQIKLEDSAFLSSLYKKYYSKRATYPFTKEEAQYINSIEELTFAFRDNSGHLSDYENGAFTGIYPDLADLLCEKLGVKCNKVLIEDLTEEDFYSEEKFILSNIYFNYAWVTDFNLSVTSPCFTLHYYQIQSNKNLPEDSSVKVAAVKNLQLTNAYIFENYTEDQIVWCNDFKECLEAVMHGNADITILNNYISEFYLSQYRYSSLSATLLDFSHATSFAVTNDKDKLITSILNKKLSLVTSDEMDAIILRNASRRENENFLTIFLHRYPLSFMLIVSASLFAVLLLTFMGITVKRSKRQNELLRRATEAKSTFLSQVSHDMRTPMNAIIGFSDICLQEESDLPTIMEYIKKISFSAKHLLNLINDVLDMSKIESGKMELHEEPILDTDLFNSMIDIIKPQMDAKNISFNLINNNSRPLYLVVDQIRVQQIFLNLLSNATKFTPVGGKIDCIIESEFLDKDTVNAVITIRDNGIGMSEGFLKELFEPFKQEHSPLTSGQSGTGLGLSIVRYIVGLMGGTIQVNSELGVGSEFIITLTTKVIIPEESSSDPAPLSEAKEYTLKDKRILLAEDNLLNQEIAEMFLQMEGMLVEIAENGQKAVELFSNSDTGYYDAVLMDIQMPIMDGFTATDEIRNLAREDAKTIPIIAMTADAFTEDMKESKLKGMDAHLSKPIDSELLYDTLQKLIK